MTKDETKLQYALDALDTLRRTLLFVENDSCPTTAERVAWQIVKDTYKAFDVIDNYFPGGNDE